MSGKSGTSADRSTAVVVPEQAREVALGRGDVPEMVKRYLRGESMQTLAAECGKTRRTIYNWFMSELGDEKYRALVTECLVTRVADADEELEKARESKDPVRVSAARETCRFVRMDLERRRPGLYGPKQEVRHTGSGPMLSIVLLDRPSGSEGGAVLDGTAVLEQIAEPAVPEMGGLGAHAEQQQDEVAA